MKEILMGAALVVATGRQAAPTLHPCTPAGVMRLLDTIEPGNADYYAGKHCVVVGQSTLVGRPMALELLNRRATVTVANSRTVGLWLDARFCVIFTLSRVGILAATPRLPDQREAVFCGARP